jgi:hypothetical protein
MLRRCLSSSSSSVATDVFNQRRQYFFYVNANGNLYSIMHPDAPQPHGPTYLRDSKQLKFFFKNLRKNDTGLFTERFPWLSLCGSGKWQEWNFVAAEDKPIVFQDLLRSPDSKNRAVLTWATARVNQVDHFTVDFDPTRLFVRHGRLYFLPFEHQALPCGGVGLIRSALCFELGQRVEFLSDDHVSLTFDDRTYDLKPLPKELE